MIIAMWVIIFVMLAMFFSKVVDHQNNPNSSVATEYNNFSKEVVLQRNRFGHYVTSGMINGHEVEFMLDTGATGVVVPASLSDKLGIKRGMPVQVHTANGTVRAYEIRLNHVSIGDIRLDNVQAILNPAEKTQTVLLGMSFLKHIEFTQRGDKLILKQLITDF